MSEALLRLYVHQAVFRANQPSLRERVARSEVGEGVISAAIAVLIMAFLGVAVWGGFKLTFDKTQKNVDQQVDQIGK
jgi:uncharacterized membrane protein (DUF485 family)